MEKDRLRQKGGRKTVMEGMEPVYYAVIPANVRFDKTLKAAEKLLFGEVSALAQKDGYAWANNRYFAKLYGVTNETISRWLSRLEKRGYIQIIPAQYDEEIPRRILVHAPQAVRRVQNMQRAQQSQQMQSGQNTQQTQSGQNWQGAREVQPVQQTQSGQNWQGAQNTQRAQGARDCLNAQGGTQNAQGALTHLPAGVDANTVPPMTENANRILQENTLKNTKKNTFAPYAFSAAVQQVLSEWLRYKQERHESYQPTGLRCFLQEMEKKLSLYPEEAVIDLVRLCMANSWKGIIWERLRAIAPQQQAQSGKEKNIFLEMLREE